MRALPESQDALLQKGPEACSYERIIYLGGDYPGSDRSITTVMFLRAPYQKGIWPDRWMTVARHRALLFFAFTLDATGTNRQKWISRIFLVGTRDNDVYGEHGKL